MQQKNSFNSKGTNLIFRTKSLKWQDLVEQESQTQSDSRAALDSN